MIVLNILFESKAHIINRHLYSSLWGKYTSFSFVEKGALKNIKIYIIKLSFVMTTAITCPVVDTWAHFSAPFSCHPHNSGYIVNEATWNIENKKKSTGWTTFSRWNAVNFVPFYAGGQWSFAVSAEKSESTMLFLSKPAIYFSFIFLLNIIFSYLSCITT